MNVHEIEIKCLTEEYISRSVDLYIDVFTNEPWNDVIDSRDQVTAFFKNFLKNNYYLGYVAVKEDKVIALCVGMKKPWLDILEYYIDEFCVSREFQGEGLGSYFINEVEKKAKEQGVKGFLCNTEKNFPSRTFYEKNGYKVIGDLVVLGK